MSHPSRIVWLTACLMQAWTLPAFAYIDPGTGSMIWQIILSAILGIGFSARSLWQRLPIKRRNDTDAK
jgi:predicted membrane protein